MVPGVYRSEKSYEVVVVGGGVAGLAASLAAARKGAKTLLIERYAFLGGMATAGLVHHFDPVEMIQVKGIAREFYDKLKARGAVKEFPIEEVEMPYSFWEGGCGFDPEEFKVLALDLLAEAKVDLLLHSFVTDVVVEDGLVKGVVVDSKSGKMEIAGKVFIDATGDGDVAALAGAEFEQGDENGVTMSPTLCFRLGGVNLEALFEYLEKNPDELGYHPRLGKYIRNPRRSSIIQGFRSLLARAYENGDLSFRLPENGLGMVRQPRDGEFHVNALRTPDVNCTDVVDLTTAEISQRRRVGELVRFIKKYIPGCQNAYLIDTAAQIGVRESRRIRGDYVLTEEDLAAGKKFEDAVVTAKWAHTDVHSGKDSQWSFSFIEGPYQVPLRSLIVRDCVNLLMAGRCISTTRQVMASLRIMPLCMATGEGAGVAAALATGSGKTVRQIEGHELRKAMGETAWTY